MSELSMDPITHNVTAFMREERRRRRWSAQTLADACEAFGAAQVPPIPSTLTRSKIAKLENGAASHANVSDIYLLAGAFAVSPDVILAGGGQPINWSALPSYTAREHGARTV